MSRDLLKKITAEKEEYYIGLYKPSLNVLIGKSLRHKTNYDWTKKADRSHLRGVPRTELVRNKISKKLLNKPLTDETKLAISVAKGNPILVKCLKNNTEIEYPSIRKLYEALKIKFITVKKYLDTDKVYKKGKEYKFYSIKK